ncbi:MAG: 50S ribosomal protein L33 [Bacilli bacterium]
MAKKGNREGVLLRCEECGNQPYLTSKNKKNTDGKLELKKFCTKCNKTTLHKERKA